MNFKNVVSINPLQIGHAILRMRSYQYAICIAANSSQSVNIVTQERMVIGCSLLKVGGGLDRVIKNFRQPFRVKRSIVKVTM